MSDDTPKLIIYSAKDGRPDIRLRVEGGTDWLTQLELAELFATSKQNISLHIRNILKEKELREISTVKESLTVQQEGVRRVQRPTKLFNLEMILAVGYRVKSLRGTQFRQWATTHLSEFLVKGFMLDDERLKNPGHWDYFDELLARIREIRASEKRFYQKVRDLFTLSLDYQDNPTVSALFFAETQNKMLFAVTGKTAAEIVVSRSDPTKPNMNLQTWSGSRVRKQDVLVAKNYLTHDEVENLNRLTVIFLEQAELRVKEHKQLTLDYWRKNVERLLEFNDRPILRTAGSISTASMKTIAEERYEQFDEQRRYSEAIEADQEDISALEEAEKKLLKRPPEKDE
jgi:hypothetical protein